MASEVSDLFKQLVKVYAGLAIDYPQLKAITIAQWMLESGRGTSELSTQHLNFGGLKWRPEMEDFATKVGYTAHDGFNFYCSFDSLAKFLKGYWRFLERSPYDGWKNHVATPQAFIGFIGPKYTPSTTYVGKVLDLLSEAEQLLASAPVTADDLPEDASHASSAIREFRVVIDPGHGGSAPIGNSSPNNATSSSGRLEKEMTLDMAQRVRSALGKSVTASTDIILKVQFTRDNDVNFGLHDRANVARDFNAHAFLSIHFNAFDKHARGPETWVLPEEQNVNYAEDVAFANRIQAGVLGGLRKHDPGTPNRGIKAERFGVLNDVALGNTAAQHRCRACLVEIEFIDVPVVDELLKKANVCDDIAAGIAAGILDDLRSRPV